MPFSAYLSVLFLLALGRLMGWRELLPAATPDVLNRIVLTLCLPAVMLLHVPELEFSLQLAPLVWVPWTLLGLTVAVVLPLSRALQLPREITAALLLLIPLGNTSFLGYPLTAALMGRDAVGYAVVYDQLGSFIMLCSYAMFIQAWYGDGERPTAASLVQRMVRFPPFAGLLFAAAFGNDWVPEWLTALLNVFADMLLPLVMIAIGMSLRLRLVRQYRAPLAWMLGARLLMLPAVALGLLWLAGMEGTIAQVAVLESAMPTMVTAGILLVSAQLAAPLANATVAWGIVLSVVTIPFWHMLAHTLLAAT